MNSTVAAMATRAASRNEEIRSTLMDCYALADANPVYTATQEAAVDCAERLLNVVLNLRKPNEGLGLRATLDLSVGLNGNPFWQKHGMVLMPLLHTAIQAQADFIILATEKQANPNSTVYDSLLHECELAGLEMFVMIGFLLAGSDFMAVRGLEIKKKLAHFLMV